MTPKIDKLESEKASLEALIASGGEYIPDRYGCVDWEDFSEELMGNLQKRVERIQKELIKLYINLTAAYA